MPYAGALLSRFDGTLDGNWNFWLYRSADPFATVSAPNYFADARSRGVKRHDLLIVVDTATPATTFATVLTVTDTTCTISQGGATIANAGMVSISGDSAGVIPPSAPNGWAIGSNYDQDYAVDLWNTTNDDGAGFNFRQKTGAATANRVAQISGDGVYSEVDLLNGLDQYTAAFGGDNAGAYLASFSNLPIRFTANYFPGAPPLVTFYPSGGASIGNGGTDPGTNGLKVIGPVVVGAPTGGAKGAGTVNATAVYANNVLLTSDAHQKRDIEPLSQDCLDLVRVIQPKSYRLVGPEMAERRNWGFIAQDVAKAMQTAGCDFGGVVIDQDGYSLSYADMVAVLWKAVQELAAEKRGARGR